MSENKSKKDKTEKADKAEKADSKEAEPKEKKGEEENHRVFHSGKPFLLYEDEKRKFAFQNSWFFTQV